MIYITIFFIIVVFVFFYKETKKDPDILPEGLSFNNNYDTLVAFNLKTEIYDMIIYRGGNLMDLKKVFNFLGDLLVGSLQELNSITNAVAKFPAKHTKKDIKLYCIMQWIHSKSNLNVEEYIAILNNIKLIDNPDLVTTINNILR